MIQAYVAMDHTLDWLYAATRWSIDGGVTETTKQLWPDDPRLQASIQDIDLVIAWIDTQPHCSCWRPKISPDGATTNWRRRWRGSR